MTDGGARVALEARWILDGKGDAVIEGGKVLLEGSTIAAVGHFEIPVEGNPLQDLRYLADVVLVIREGVIVRRS